MITVKPEKRTVRETKAPYEYDDNGELKTTDIRVRYFSATTKELKDTWLESQAKIKAAVEAGETPVFWHADKLAKRLESLPDLVDENGKAFTITLDFLENLDAKNVAAILQAIEEDENPKPKAHGSA